MRKLQIPKDYYTSSEQGFVINKPKFIGIFELLYMGVQTSPLQNLTRRDHKVINRLKSKLESISVYKDKDEDSKILIANKALNDIDVEELWLETDEYEMLTRLLEAQHFSARVSEVVETMWNVIESAQEASIAKQAEI